MTSSESSYVCDEYRMPFSSKRELEMHNETFHPKKSIDKIN